MKKFEIVLHDLEKVVTYSAREVHERLKELQKYEKLSKNEKIEKFLGSSYIWAARWHEGNRKFDLEEKIVSIGEDFIGIALSLDEIAEGKFPIKHQREIQIISNLIYGDNENSSKFICDLKRNAREIHEILTGELNRPKVYF